MTRGGRGVVTTGDHIDFSRSTFQGDAIGKVVYPQYGPAPTATSALPSPPAAFIGLSGVGKTAPAVHTAYIARERGWFPGGAGERVEQEGLALPPPEVHFP
ncbi:hypothetical protein AB0O76_23780 [Streptomyces sp. NPDC086554]|uniref:hypothetical protein n=1 Tax=Streptomyces sp. NPDC086554 TaxID=3154864 RepID=UPI00342F07F3